MIEKLLTRISKIFEGFGDACKHEDPDRSLAR